MENVSKALIIAGAILIAILLISVGIMVMNSVNKPIDVASGEATSQAAQVFNAKFTPYEGANKTAQDVKALCMAVQASNSADSSHKIGMLYKNKAGTIYKKQLPNDVISKLDNKYSYDINVYYTTKKLPGPDGYDVYYTQPTPSYSLGYNMDRQFGINVGESEFGYIGGINIFQE